MFEYEVHVVPAPFFYYYKSETELDYDHLIDLAGKDIREGIDLEDLIRDSDMTVEELNG